MKGIVIKSTGSWYSVLTTEGDVWECRIKGRFRIKDIKSTNPLAVGDRVEFESEMLEDKPFQGLITDLFERDNYIIRRAINLSKQTQIIAANIDLALLIVTFAKPRTSFGFIDRFLVSAEAYHIPTHLVFNKIDIYEPDDLAYIDEIKEMYNRIGYPVHIISAKNNFGIEDLMKHIQHKTTLISGHSGVGKSTLVNLLVPGLKLKTTAVSEASDKGVHTTTFAEMHSLKDGGFIIDTPGIRELGVVDIPDDELSHYFPEMKSRISNCKFNNCSHTNEPGCAIKKAVDNAEISILRYESYLSILAAEDNRK
jgi:ribosome biogenesis GTPase